MLDLGNVVLDFKDTSEAATVVELLTHSPELTLVPSTVVCSKLQLESHKEVETVIADPISAREDDESNTGSVQETLLCPTQLTPAAIDDAQPPTAQFEDISEPAVAVPEVSYKNVVEQPSLPAIFGPVKPLNIVKKPRRRRLRMSDFVIICRLGEGGFGVVLLVSDKVSRRFYALKIVYKEGLSMEAMERVFEEQRIGRAVADAGCQWMVGVEGSWEDDRKFYMLMVRSFSFLLAALLS